MARLNVSLAVRTAARALSGGPIVTARHIPRALRSTFGSVETLDGWNGETASYARARADGAPPLFVKYRRALDFDARAFARFQRETLYLRAFAPRVDVPHAALLHAASDDATRKAHVVLRDLTDETRGWGDLDERERLAKLPHFTAIVARLHGAWAGHAALSEHPTFPWAPVKVAEKARAALARVPAFGVPSDIEAAAKRLRAPNALETLLSAPTIATMTHGDLHFGQVLFSERGAYLVDYQHAGVAPLGFDLAHLLGLRLSLVERRALEDEVLAAYARALEPFGVKPDLHAELRVGAILNFVAMWRRSAREPSETFRNLLVRAGVLLHDVGVTT
ncbi:phosphotransferase family protein [Deinococcus yavapaiensis]|uniref:Ecdysteroid kinase n=1 Tax=Deinococcus yavapaiensis KR-236 TaxID=694435 RepID=A0A318S9Z4_9DEIO|nr:DUF1679 domain-containing protein [Deinococcus yavapaiensis]PYE53054.1 ecdysteroid kinase [Deinococcus yavapaiensis KR-236]